jgi:hypothetical protein
MAIIDATFAIDYGFEAAAIVFANTKSGYIVKIGPSDRAN